MALYRNLWNLSVEEDDVTGAAGGEAESAIAPEEAAEQAAEVQEQAEKVDGDAVALEESMEAIEELQETIDVNEEVLENNPESVTEDMVASSNECFAFTMGVLGMKRDDYLVNRVSTESCSSPAEKLQVSTEAMKEHLKNAYERIKLFFKQLGVQIKKLIVRIMAFFNTAEKRAKELIKQIKKMDSKYDKVNSDNDEIKSFIISKGQLLLLDNSYPEVLNENMKNEINVVLQFVDGITDKIKWIKDVKDNLKKMINNFMAKFTNMQKLAPEQMMVKDIEDANPYSDMSNVESIPIRFYPHSVGVLYSGIDEDDRCHITYKNVKLEFNESGYINPELKKADILKMLDEATNIGRQIKYINDISGRQYDQIINAAEKLYKEESDGTSRDEKSKAKMRLQVAKIKAARFYSESALGLMQKANAIIQLGNLWKVEVKRDVKNNEKNKK